MNDHCVLRAMVTGQSGIVTGVSDRHIPACGGVELIHDTRDLPYTYKGETTVIPAFIAGVRKKLALDQREAAEIFGGGVNAFSRYGNGKTKPPLTLVKLLKVLDRHPELIDEVR